MEWCEGVVEGRQGDRVRSGRHTKGIVVLYTYKCVPLDPLCPIVLLREDADDVPCVIIVKTLLLV